MRHLPGPQTGSSLPFRNPDSLLLCHLHSFVVFAVILYKKVAWGKDGEHGADIFYEQAWDNPDEVIYVPCVLSCLEIDLPFFSCVGVCI